MFALLSSHKKIIIGVVLVVLLFIAYGAFMPKKDTSDAPLARQNTANSSGFSDPNSPGRQFVSQLLAIQNIHYNLELFGDPAYAYLQDFSRELIPQEVGRDNPFAPLDGGIGSDAFVTEREGSFINTSATTTSGVATSTPRTNQSTPPPRR